MKCFFRNDKDLGPSITIKAFNRTFGFCLCHRREDRCVKFLGLEHIMCSRCLAIWLGYLLGASIFTMSFRIPIQISLLMIFPMLIDGFSQNLGIRESNNRLRIITGILFGMGFASFMLITIVYGI